MEFADDTVCFAEVDSRDFEANVQALAARGKPSMSPHWRTVLVAEQIINNGGLFDAVMRDAFDNVHAITTPAELQARVENLKRTAS